MVGVSLLMAIALTTLALQTESSNVTVQKDSVRIGEQEAPIIVVGERTQDSERALKNCIVKKCPPTEDIAASLRHAENLFVAGDYHAARRTLLASRTRNQRFRKQYPVDVADLLRANARVAAHMGESESFYSNTLDSLSALKAGLPPDDPRVLAGRIELGDSYARLGRFTAAEDVYRAVARRAHDLELPSIEGFGLLRLAMMYTSLAARGDAAYGLVAKQAVDALINSSVPGLQPFASAARVLRARQQAKRGDATAVDRLIASLPPVATADMPILIVAPPIDLPQLATTAFGGNARNRVGLRDVENQWVDIGFWVTPDGKVSEPTVLRESPQLEGDWVKPVLKAIAGRRYAATARDPSGPGAFRVERYTYTARWTTTTGSRLRVRDRQQQIETLDLTPVAPAPKKDG